jgi:hypothetical protein
MKHSFENAVPLLHLPPGPGEERDGGEQGPFHLLWGV